MLKAGHSAHSIVSTSDIYAPTIYKLYLKRFLSFRSLLVATYLIFFLVISDMLLTLLSFRRQKLLFKS